MKIQELRQLTPKKLQAELEKTVRSLSVLRFHIATGQAQNTAKVKSARKLIAQIKTLLNNPAQ